MDLGQGALLRAWNRIVWLQVRGEVGLIYFRYVAPNAIIGLIGRLLSIHSLHSDTFIWKGRSIDTIKSSNRWTIALPSLYLPFKLLLIGNYLLLLASFSPLGWVDWLELGHGDIWCKSIVMGSIICTSIIIVNVINLTCKIGGLLELRVVNCGICANLIIVWGAEGTRIRGSISL